MFAADKVQNVPCGRVIYEKLRWLLYLYFISFIFTRKSELLSVGQFAFEDVEPFLDKIATDSTKTTIKKNDFVTLNRGAIN